MGIPNTTKQAASNAVAALGAWISVHSTTAGTTGTGEATGGNYVRRQTVWTPGTTGLNTGSTVNCPVAAGTYVEGGIFSASAGGNFVGSDVWAGGNVVVSGTGASIDITPSIQA